jgi:hypothetical protein
MILSFQSYLLRSAHCVVAFMIILATAATSSSAVFAAAPSQGKRPTAQSTESITQDEANQIAIEAYV